MDQVSGDGRMYLVQPPNTRIRIVFPGGKRKPHIVRAWGKNTRLEFETDTLCARRVMVESESRDINDHLVSNLCRVCVSMARRIRWI